MIRRFLCFVVTIIVLDAVALFAQEGTTKPAEGTLTLSKKTYQLANGVAYESATGGEPDLTVVLTASPVSNEKLNKALATEKEGGFGEFPQPFLKLIFKKTGELKNFSAVGGGTTIGGSSDGTGELKLQDGRVVGKASATLDPSAIVPKGFDVRFDVALHHAGEQLPVSTAKNYGPAANVKPSVTGIFKGNGKDANLAFVSAHWVEPFSGKTGIMLLFTEKDHSKVKKPDIDAMFGKFGSALIISLHEDGDIYGCQVVHSAHKKQGFSSIGSMETSGFNYDAGKVEGELTTNGQAETFGDTWEVKLKFIAPLGEIPKEFQAAETSDSEKATTKESKEESSDDNDEGEMAAAMANTMAKSEPNGKSASAARQSLAAGPKAKELALTNDATDVEYKALVEQMSFKSKLPVTGACSELTKNLKAQGWSKEESDLINSSSSILKRKRGGASLTIFVKPANGGSEIKIMSEGLSWDEE